MLLCKKSANSTLASFSLVIDPSATLLVDTASFANLLVVTAPFANCAVFIEFTGYDIENFDHSIPYLFGVELSL
jgi:hypothetical protein